MNTGPQTALITGTGRYLPGEPIDSGRLSRAMPGLPVDIFHQYFGVDTRHYAVDPESGENRTITAEDGSEIPLSTTEMGAQAAIAAIAKSGIDASEIDAVITNSTTPDGLLPPFALLIQRRLNIGEAQLLDLRGGCSASIQALNVATMLIESGRARAVLIVSSEFTSQYYFRRLRDMKDPHFNDVVNGLLFADGAGAIVVESRDRCEARGKDGYAVTYSGTKSCFAADRAGFSLVNKASGGVETKHDHRAIRNTLPKVVERGYSELTGATGKGPADFDVTIIPQVNQSMIQLVSGEGMDPEKMGFCYYGRETGNIPAAAMFMALDIATERGRIEPGDDIGILSIETTSWNYAVASLHAETMGARQ